MVVLLLITKINLSSFQKRKRKQILQSTAIHQLAKEVRKSNLWFCLKFALPLNVECPNQKYWKFPPSFCCSCKYSREFIDICWCTQFQFVNLNIGEHWNMNAKGNSTKDHDHQTVFDTIFPRGPTGCLTDYHHQLKNRKNGENSLFSWQSTGEVEIGAGGRPRFYFHFHFLPPGKSTSKSITKTCSINVKKEYK